MNKACGARNNISEGLSDVGKAGEKRAGARHFFVQQALPRSLSATAKDDEMLWRFWKTTDGAIGGKLRGYVLWRKGELRRLVTSGERFLAAHLVLIETAKRLGRCPQEWLNRGQCLP